MQKFFDSHFHYYADMPEAEYLSLAHEAGVAYLLAVGADYEESEIAASLAEHNKNCWFSAGAHPHQAAKFATDISMFAKFAAVPDFVAVGEIGLDYFYEHSERAVQRQVMAKFLSWSLEIGKPAIIHCRDQNDTENAYLDAAEMLKDFAADGGSFVVHCFTGTAKWAEKFLEMGAFLGITGIVTFPKAHNVREVINLIPSDKLLVETDSPYLAPVPFRGKKNHPSYLPAVVAKIAELKGVSSEKLAETTTGNAIKFFHLKP